MIQKSGKGTTYYLNGNIQYKGNLSIINIMERELYIMKMVQ